MKIVFDSKMSKDEILTRHQENPFKWPRGFGNFEFYEDVPIAYIRCPKPDISNKYCHYNVKRAMIGLGAKSSAKIYVVMDTTKKLIRVTFDAKITKDEVIKAHKRKPFWWTD